MALTPRSPAVQTYMKHTPPSGNDPRPHKHNTVHWDRHDLDIAVKENAAPAAHHCSPREDQQQSASLRAPEQPLDAFLDFGDRKFRGQQRRPRLAAETFLVPESLTEAAAAGAETDRGPLIQAFRLIPT